MCRDDVVQTASGRDDYEKWGMSNGAVAVVEVDDVDNDDSYSGCC